MLFLALTQSPCSFYRIVPQFAARSLKRAQKKQRKPFAAMHPARVT